MDALEKPTREPAPIDEQIPEPPRPPATRRYEISPNDKGPGTLVKEIAEDLSKLMRKEVELAKTEVSELVRSKLISAGFALVALVMALLFLPFFLLSMIEVLAIWLPRWGASLIVTGFMLGVALAAVLMAKKFFGAIGKPEHTIRTLKEDVEWAKSLKK